MADKEEEVKKTEEVKDEKPQEKKTVKERLQELLDLMERYGWVERHPTGWTITEEGRKANQRYQDWWEQVKREHNW